MLKKRLRSEDVIGLKTGLRDFDKKIGGLHKSDLIIIAGRLING